MTQQISETFRISPEQRDQFIQESRELFNRFRYSYERKTRHGWTHTDTGIHWKDALPWLEERYNEGRLLDVLDMTFEDFKNTVENDRWKRYPKWRSWNRPNCPYRNGNSYRKNTAHEKAPNEPDNRQTWREHIQLRRDQSKSRGWRRRPSNGIASFKTRSARDHRAWVKDRLHHEDWDAFHSQEYDQFVDSYAYD